MQEWSMKILSLSPTGSLLFSRKQNEYRHISTHIKQRKKQPIYALTETSLPYSGLYVIISYVLAHVECVVLMSRDKD